MTGNFHLQLVQFDKTKKGGLKMCMRLFWKVQLFDCYGLCLCVYVMIYIFNQK